MFVDWNGNGTYTPRCDVCDWEGKARLIHSEAEAAVRAHGKSKRHEHKVAQAWDASVADADSLGYTVELVQYCEGIYSPGLLGQGFGVCIYAQKLIRIRQALLPYDRVWVLRHELGHARIDASGGDRDAQRAYDDEHGADADVQARKHRIERYLYP